MKIENEVTEVKPLSIIGYRLERTFKDLDSIAKDIIDFQSGNDAALDAHLETFRGLVLFHGGFEKVLGFINKWGSALKMHRFIALFFSTDPLVEDCGQLPKDDERKACEQIFRQADLFPYIHLLSYSVPNDPDSEIKEAFKSLVAEISKLNDLEDTKKISQLWDAIDPKEKQRTEKQAMEQITALEKVIVDGRANQQILPDHQKIVKDYYGESMPTYQQLHEDYLEICRSFQLKKNLSRWQVERETLNHTYFQHYFYDLIARESVVEALDDFSLRRSAAIPPAIIQELEKWSAFKKNFSDLFLRANPEAVASCELNLALLTPDRPWSQAVIKRYKKQFGGTIEAEVELARVQLNKIDSIVKRLLTPEAEVELGENACSVRALGTELRDCCNSFSMKISALRKLSECEDKANAKNEHWFETGSDS
jgi:hypothetical protein